MILHAPYAQIRWLVKVLLLQPPVLPALATIIISVSLNLVLSASLFVSSGLRVGLPHTHASDALLATSPDQAASVLKRLKSVEVETICRHSLIPPIASSLDLLPRES